MTRIAAALFLTLAGSIAAAADATSTEADRQSLDDAWWTGPIVAAGAATLPQGHALIEPYVYDAISHGRYDGDGHYRSTDTVNSFGSLTYILYGVTDSFVMFKASQVKDEAWKLLEFLTGPTAQKMAAEAGVWSPNSP